MEGSYKGSIISSGAQPPIFLLFHSQCVDFMFKFTSWSQYGHYNTKHSKQNRRANHRLLSESALLSEFAIPYPYRQLGRNFLTSPPNTSIYLSLVTGSYGLFICWEIRKYILTLIHYFPQDQGYIGIRRESITVDH